MAGWRLGSVAAFCGCALFLGLAAGVDARFIVASVVAVCLSRLGGLGFSRIRRRVRGNAVEGGGLRWRNGGEG